MNTTSDGRASNIGACTKCGKREHWELLDAVLFNEVDSGRYEDIACYGKGWAPTGYDSFQFSIRPDLKPMYDQWLRENGG